MSSSELTKTSSQVITPVGQRLNPVNKARKLQQATQNTVKSNTEPATKDTVIIESEVDSNLLSFSQSKASYDESLRLLSVNEARKLLGIRYERVQKLINTGEIETIQINGKKRIPLIMLRKFVIKNSIAINQKREAVQDFESSELSYKLQKILNKHRKEVK